MSCDSGKWRVLCDQTLTTIPIGESEPRFLKLVFLWRNHCQSINRRLMGTEEISFESEEYLNVLKKASPEVITLFEDDNEYCQIRKLIPRSNKGKLYELSFASKSDNDGCWAFNFYPIHFDSVTAASHLTLPFQLSCNDVDSSNVKLSISVPAKHSDKECQWLLEKVFPALVKWFVNVDLSKEVKLTNRLISVDRYCDTYNRIKEKWGRDIVNKWTEKTDPKKFVYEDCGITAYLLETFHRIGRTPKQFADLGCGNGLLVHLLGKEGINGIGLDIRSRKIWASLFSSVDLRESVIDPTAEENGIPSGTDFLIGNHSDELTPWIPVMAARIKADFILIPCCPFDFHGKYNMRPGKFNSSYDGFLAFVKSICESLGFIVEEDRLSIPSTRRICFVCHIPESGLVENIEAVIASLTAPLNGQCQSKPFIARPKVSEVRNCTNIPLEERTKLTNFYFSKLLCLSDERINGWRCGGEMSIGELSKDLSERDKSYMKQQDGGLQTFLKNQHQAFQVIGGKVRIRDWRNMNRAPSKNAAKVDCWMLANHPDGCPLGEKCSFKHQ